jgi:hypothetical protein
LDLTLIVAGASQFGLVGFDPYAEAEKPAAARLLIGAGQPVEPVLDRCSRLLQPALPDSATSAAYSRAASGMPAKDRDCSLTLSRCASAAWNSPRPTSSIAATKNRYHASGGGTVALQRIPVRIQAVRGSAVLNHSCAVSLTSGVPRHSLPCGLKASDRRILGGLSGQLRLSLR